MPDASRSREAQAVYPGPIDAFPSTDLRADALLPVTTFAPVRCILRPSSRGCTPGSPSTSEAGWLRLVRPLV
jgi:hypothetical protein